MGQKSLVSLHFPLAGLNRRYGFESQPPYSTPDAMNVRPTGNSVGRERGGSRPGLAKVFPTQIGGGLPVRMLSSVMSLPPDLYGSVVEAFGSSPLNTTTWDYGSGLYGLENAPTITGGIAYPTAAAKWYGAVLDLIAALDPTKAYTVKLSVNPAPAYLPSQIPVYRLYAGLDNTTPACGTAALVVELRIGVTLSGVYSKALSIIQISGGVETVLATTSISDGSIGGTILQMNVNPTEVEASFGPLSLTSAYSTLAGKRIGFACKSENTGTSAASCDDFRLEYAKIPDTKPNMLVASSGGQIWYADTSGTLTQVSGSALNSLDLGSTQLIHAVDRLGYLYMADVGTYRGTGTKGVVGGGGTDEFTDADVTDWTAIASIGDVLWVYSAAGATTNVHEHTIKTVVAGKLTLASAATADAAATEKWRILRSVKRFSSSSPDLTSVNELVRARGSSTYGVVPGGCPLIAVYLDRLVLAGSVINPNVWYMSKAGDPLNWNYGASPTDVTRAVAGTVSDAGQKIADPITALIASSSDYLLICCRDSIWRMQGDPAGGGSVVNISRSVGVISQQAWCHGPEGQIIFLSRSGLCSLPPGADSYPEMISADLMPDELSDVDPITNAITMAYDGFHRGVHIFVTGTLSRHWWYDWATKSFWPVGVSTTNEPLSLGVYRESGSGVSDVLLGCRDGYVRRFLDTATTDDGTAFTSYVDYGPVRMNRGVAFDGMITALNGVLAAGSGSVTWEIRAGDATETAVNASPQTSGTWTAGMNYASNPRVRGCVMVVRVTSTNAWEIEAVDAEIMPCGRYRKA